MPHQKFLAPSTKKLAFSPDSSGRMQKPKFSIYDRRCVKSILSILAIGLKWQLILESSGAKIFILRLPFSHGVISDLASNPNMLPLNRRAEVTIWQVVLPSPGLPKRARFPTPFETLFTRRSPILPKMIPSASCQSSTGSVRLSSLCLSASLSSSTSSVSGKDLAYRNESFFMVK